MPFPPRIKTYLPTRSRYWIARAYGRFLTRVLGVLVVSFGLLTMLGPTYRLGDVSCFHGCRPPSVEELQSLRNYWWGFDRTATLTSQFSEFMVSRIFSGPVLAFILIATVIGVAGYAWEFRR